MNQSSKIPNTFDSRRIEARKTRAIARADQGALFLFDRAANDIAERLGATNREFQNPLDLFSLTPTMLRAMGERENVTSPKRIAPDYAIADGNLGLEAQNHDLITSVGGLHWLNDMPGAFLQIARALKPDGLFLAALPGDGTLAELRDSLLIAEAGLTEGAAMRIDPFPDIRQVGGLLQRAGLKLPVTDVDSVVVRYDDVYGLIRDLRSMGATSVLTDNRERANRKLFQRANEIYREKYADSDGRIRATFNIIHLSGWAAHESQQQPLKPGSAKVSLKSVLGSEPGEDQS